jgi:hypothetical protein
LNKRRGEAREGRPAARILRRLGRICRKTLLADTDDGFFVSSGDEFFWLVSHEGKLLLRCNDSCSIPK